MILDKDLIGNFKIMTQFSIGFGFITEFISSETNDTLTDNSSDKVPTNNPMEFSSDSEEKNKDIEQDPGCNILCSENAVIPTPGSSALKNFQSKPHSKCRVE
ncbi:hypothetical protein TNCV_792121 [Trichonephila clavipes]|nr:hypothetical protein TNCV_792121 [Trichonephila clavipes]